MGRYTFTVPTNIPEAKRRKRVAEAEVDDINFQLADRARRSKRGGLLTTEEYLRWSRGAKASRLQKGAEVRFLKDWIAEARLDVERRNLGVNGSTDRALLARMHGMLSDLLQDSDISPLIPTEAHSICALTHKHLRAV